MHWRVKDLTGARFERLVVVSHIGVVGGSRNHKWLCVCECGAKKIVSGCALRSGDTKSCGCLQRAVARSAGDRTRTHGQTKTSLYNIWDSMRQRCNNPNRKDYKSYGARGIKVCDKWSSFEAFRADMGDRPHGMTINRKDNNGDYEPNNCEWSSVKDQAKNTSANVFLSMGGATQCMASWAEQIGMKYETLYARKLRGWSDEDALTKQIQRKLSHV